MRYPHRTTLLILLVLGLCSYGHRTSAGGQIQARWSTSELKVIISALNSNDSEALRPYTAYIDGRESLDLRGVNFSGETFRDIWILGKWEIVHLDGADLSGALFENVSLRAAHLSFVDAVDSRFIATTLDYAEIRQVDFSNSVFKNVSFIGATIDEVSFGNSELSSVDFFEAHRLRASFDTATLRDVRFMGANLNDASFFLAVGNQLDFERARLKNVGFRRATLSDVDFDEADLSWVNFQGAITTDTSMVGTTLYRPFLSGWNSDSIDFRYVVWADPSYLLGDEIALPQSSSYPERFRLQALQVQNAYSALADSYQGYGYTTMARIFSSHKQRIRNRLIRGHLYRMTDYLANELTHDYGRHPLRLLLSAVFVVVVFTLLYLLMSAFNFKWCCVRRPKGDLPTTFVNFSPSWICSDHPDESGAGWLRRTGKLNFSGTLVNCLALSVNMIFFAAGGLLKIPRILNLFRLKDMEYGLYGAGRIVAGSEALCGLWLMYLLVRDLLEIIG